MDNQTTLAYMRKMGGKVNQKMNQMSKEWEFLIGNGITVAV